MPSDDLPRPARRDRVVEVRPAHRPDRRAAHGSGRSRRPQTRRRGSRGMSFARRVQQPARTRAGEPRNWPASRPKSSRICWNGTTASTKEKPALRFAQRGPAGYLFRDGCPGGESVAAVAERVDRLAAKLKGLTGNVLCFAHGHLLRVLAARWVGQPVAFAGCLLLGTATVCVLAFDHNSLDEPAIKVWNS